MSWETQAWAGRMRPGSASAKLVLLGLAQCADANHCAYPSVDWLCEFSDLNRKTVIAALDRLGEGEERLIEDTGQRKGRTGQVKVYRLRVLDVAIPSRLARDPASETVPKAEQFQKRNSSTFSRKESQKRDTEPFREPLPPCSPDGEQTPAADFDEGSGEGEQGSGSAASTGAAGDDTQPEAKPRGHRLPADWSPPPIADLPPLARALVEQWPAGAYEMVCETFRLHWQTETRAIAVKRDWTAALGKWLITDHPRIIRDAKHGVSFAAVAPAKVTPARAPKPVAAKVKEGPLGERIHAALRQSMDERSYRQWIEPAALIVHTRRGDLEAGLHIVSPSSFAAGWLKENLSDQITQAFRAGFGGIPAWMDFKHEQASNGVE